MAKKDRLDFGRDSWDPGLDFDFDDDFDIPKPSSKKSTPISQIADGIKSSLRTKFTDSSHIRGMIRKALPDGFGQAWDSIDQIVTDTSQLYDEATKELKPVMGSISRKFDQLVPDSAQRTKNFAKSLRDKFDDEIDNTSAYNTESAEDQGIARMMAELEDDRENNEESRHRQRLAYDQIQSRVEDKRFLANQKMLGIIANDIHAIRRYQSSFDIAYKKKSLELQYRTYAATATMLKHSIEFQKRSLAFQDALLHNTSLPEYAKTSNVQRWKQVSKEQIFGRFNDGLFGAKSRVGLAGQRLMKMGRDKISGGKDALEMLNDALDMAIDSRDMDREMAELEGRESSGWRTAGTFGGSILGDFLSNWVSGLVKRQVEKNPKFMKRSFQAGRLATNPGGAIDMMKNSNWYKKLGSSGSEFDDLLQNGLGFMFDLLAGEKPDMLIKSTSIGKEGENKLHTQMKVNRSLTEVIPGYLARILREVTALRTGDDKTPLLMYDVKSESFKSQASLARDIVANLKRTATEAGPGLKTYNDEAQEAYRQFVGSEKLDTTDAREVQSFINRLARSSEDIDMTGERLKSTKEFKSLNPRVKKIVERILDKRFSGDSLEVAKNQFQFASNAAKVKSSIGNLMGPIQEAIREGYGDLLQQQGIISRDKDGNWKVDEEQYYKFFDDSVTVPSDVNLKHNISKSHLDPTKSVNAFKKTQIYDWDYKPGTKYAGPKGYGKQNYTGPMAQDVRANFGDDSAPGGKTIDLVNLNGHTMAAVKKLAEMVESMGAGESTQYLKNIDANTAIILELVSGMSKDTRRSDTIGGLGDLLSNKLSLIREEISSFRNKFRNSESSEVTTKPIDDKDTQFNKRPPYLDEILKTIRDLDFKDQVSKTADAAKSMAAGAWDNIRSLTEKRNASEAKPQYIDDLMQVLTDLKNGQNKDTSKDGSKEAITGVSGAIGFLVTKTLNLMVSAGEKILDTGKATKDLGKKLWSDNQEQIKEIRGKLLTTATAALNKSVEFSSDLLFNQVPKLSKTTKDILNNVFDGVKNIIQTVEDIYVEGIDSPVIVGSLLAAGYYFDSVTGKSLKTMDDVVRAKGDIVDSANNVKLSVIDRAKGMRTKSGKILKTFNQNALSMAKTGALYVAGKSLEAFDKVKEKFQKADFSKMYNASKDKATQIKNKITDKLSDIQFGFGGSDPRVVPILIQIRDLLAIGKSGKKVKEIMGRSLTEPSRGSTTKSGSSNGTDAVDENPDRVNTSLLTQLRDLAAADKPKEILDNIYNRSRNARAFMNAPLFGAAVKSWFEKIKGNGGAQSAMAQMGPEMFGPAPEMVGPQQPATARNYSGGAGMGGIIGALGGLFGAGQQAAGSLAGAFNQRFPNARGRWGNSRLGRLGGKIRGSRFGQWASNGIGMAGSAIGGAASMLGGLFSNPNADPNQQREERAADAGANTYSARDHAMRLLQLGGNKAANAYKRVRGMFGDTDGDGQRDGGVADRMQNAQANQIANEERKKAAIEASKQGAEQKANRNSPADNAIEKMIAMATAGLSSIAGMASSLIGGAADLLGGVRRPGHLIKRAGKAVWSGAKMLGSGALMAGQGILKAGRVVAGIGTGIKSVLGTVPGAAKVARVGTTAVRALQVVGLAAGGAGGILSGAASLIGSALSSPLVIGAAAVAGVGYGGYKLYKYLTRNSIDDWERIRVMQYGLDGTDATKQYNSKVIALEKYLLDGKLAFSGGIPTINTRAAKPEEIAELFDIAADDTETAQKFSTWYTERFSPVFLKHVSTLYRVNNKASLEKVDSLTDSEKLEYLSGIELPRSIWDKTTSPFKGLDILSSNPEPVKKIIDAKIQTLGKKIQDEAAKKAKAGGNKPSPQEAKMANEAIKSAIPDAPKTERTNPTQAQLTPTQRRAIPPNSHLGRAIANGDVEDPAAMGKPSSNQGGGTLSMNASSLKLASGPLASGDSGMQYLKLGNGVNIEGLHPRMKQQLLAMAQEYGEATGKQLNVTSAYRSFQDQQRMYAKYGPGRAARPGGSLHEYGLAADLSTADLNELEKLGLLRKYGFTRPIYGETWHIEPAGIQSAIDQAKRDPNFADSAILASIGRGGGGVGATPRSPVGGRNPAMAKALYEQAGGIEVKLTDAQGLPPSPASNLNSPVVQGKDLVPAKAIQENASKGFSAIGRQGGNIEFSGNNDASASMDGKHADIKQAIAKHSAEIGANPNEMMMLAAMESSFNPGAKAGTSSASGLMQFTDATWKEQLEKHGGKYGLSPFTPRDDIRANVILAHEYMKSNGAKGDFTQKYMTHMLGAAGSARLNNANPQDLAYRISPKQANSNREVFFDGSRPRTVQEVKDFLANRVSKKANDFGIALGSPTATPDSAPGASIMGGGLTQASYNPTKPKVYDPTASAGDLPDFNPTAMTLVKDTTSPVRAVRPSMTPASVPGVAGYGSAGAGSRDTAIQMTAQVMDRFTKSTEEQVKHLSSIDTSISDKVVPLLERIAENTQSLTTMGGAGGNPQGGSSGPAVRNFATDNPKRKADTSSFDNRRVL